MNITRLRLENFKCFESIDAKLNKLTLITGANSSGKSSLIYGLLTPFQSGGFPLNFSTNGKYVNMGNFEDISHLHNRNNIIKIGFDVEARLAFSIDTYWKIDKARKLPKLHKLNVHNTFFNLTIKTDINDLFILKFEYNSDKEKKESIHSFEFQKKLHTLLNEAINQNFKNKIREDTYLKKLEIKFSKNNKNITLKAKDLNSLKAQIDEKGSYALSMIFNEVINIFKRLDEKINYISSFRFHPQKLRNEITKDNLRIGKYGDNYEDQILHWQTNSSEDFDRLVTKLNSLGILKNIKTQRVVGGNYELKVKTHSSGVFSSLTDVGFGISQFLPIIVSDLQLGNGSTLLISQPEIHLHPKIQSDFGDYILNEIHNCNKRYILETHSEYLINKIRLLIVQKKLKSEDVNIYHFQKKGNRTIKHELKFTADGQILNAPPDFFDTYMTDIMNIALNS